MKAILEYNLDKQEDCERFDVASKSHDLFFVLFDLDQLLRGYIKHGHKFKDTDQAIEHIRQELTDMMIDRRLSFDMVE